MKPTYGVPKGIPAHEIEGYVLTDDQSILCQPCLKGSRRKKQEVYPIFAQDEFGWQPYCEDCGYKLEVSVIEEDE